MLLILGPDSEFHFCYSSSSSLYSFWYMIHHFARLPDWPRFVQCMHQIIKGMEL